MKLHEALVVFVDLSGRRSLFKKWLKAHWIAIPWAPSRGVKQIQLMLHEASFANHYFLAWMCCCHCWCSLSDWFDCPWVPFRLGLLKKSRIKPCMFGSCRIFIHLRWIKKCGTCEHLRFVVNIWHSALCFGFYWKYWRQFWVNIIIILADLLPAMKYDWMMDRALTRMTL